MKWKQLGSTCKQSFPASCRQEQQIQGDMPTPPPFWWIFDSTFQSKVINFACCCCTASTIHNAAKGDSKHPKCTTK